jgi:trigger factor
MNITKENVDDLNARLRIKIEEADYNERVDEVLKDYRKKVTLNGFRPGKVPAGLVRKMYRTPVMVEEINKLVSESITNFIKDEDLKILGEPLPSQEEKKEIDWEKETEFEFYFDLGLAPQFEIALTQKDKVPIYNITIDQKMINETKDSYAGRMGEMVPKDAVEGEETLKGDWNQIDKDGNLIEGGIVSEDSSLVLSVVKDKKIKTSFTARQVGESVDLDIKKAFPNDTEISSLLKIEKEQVAEIASNFRFTIKEISEFRKAEINQDMWDTLYGKDEVKSMEEFEDKIREELQKGLSRDADYRFTIDAKNAMLKKYKFDLPVEFLKRWLVLANEEKFTAEQIEEDFPKFEDDLKWQLIRDRIVKDQEFKVEAEEVMASAKEMALMQFQQYGMMNVPDENLENYAQEMLKNEEEQRRTIDRVLEKKVFDYIRETVKVDNKQITIDKFNKLFENN